MKYAWVIPAIPGGALCSEAGEYCCAWYFWHTFCGDFPGDRTAETSGGIMPVTAWIMLIIGCLVLYGGLSVCIAIAFRSKK